MITVNSLSGGKTSSYLAVHYPADYNIFSLVCVDDEDCKYPDESIRKCVNDRLIGVNEWGEFIGTVEDDKLIKVIMDLEQKIGKEITWVRGESFDSIIKRKKAIPNQIMRFCTTEMKMLPIFHFCKNNIADVVSMRLGIRWDEQERVNRENTHMKVVVGKRSDGRNEWSDVYWRELEYPLVDNKIYHYPIIKYWEQESIDFPKDSNCLGCYWKDVQQLRKNLDEHPNKMRWFIKQEAAMKRRFKKEISYKTLYKIGLQSDFNFGTGSGCQAGFCTD